MQDYRYHSVNEIWNELQKNWNIEKYYLIPPVPHPDDVSSRFQYTKSSLFTFQGGFIDLSMAPKDNRLKDYLFRVMEMLKFNARTDVNSFIEFVSDDATHNICQAWFHKEWQHLITNYNRLFIMAHRESAKTSQILPRFLFELGHDINLLAKFVTATGEDSVKRSRYVMQTIERNHRFRLIFPHIKPSKGNWSTKSLEIVREVINKEPTLEACSVLGSNTGGRASWVMVDDIVGFKNALQSPSYITTVKKAWNADWEHITATAGKVVYIATPWSEQDLSSEISQRSDYHTVVYNIEDDLKPIWYPKWTRKIFKQKFENDPVEFDRGYKLRTISDGEKILRPTAINYVDLKDIEVISQNEDLRFFLSYDLANENRPDSDHFGCVKGFYNMIDRTLYIYDAYSMTASMPEQVNLIKRDFRQLKGHCQAVFVESTGYQTSLVDYFKSLDTDKLPINFIKMKPLKEKKVRLKYVSPLMYQKRIVFMSDMLYENGVDFGTKRHYTKKALVKQLESFTGTTKDGKKDLVDAFSQLGFGVYKEFYFDPEVGLADINIFYVGKD